MIVTRRWREFLNPITERSRAKPKQFSIMFESKKKTAPISRSKSGFGFGIVENSRPDEVEPCGFPKTRTKNRETAN